MAKNHTKKPSTTPQSATPSPRKRENVAESRSTQSSADITSSRVLRVAQSATSQRVVKPVIAFSPGSRITRSQKRSHTAPNYSENKATELLDAANHQSTTADDTQVASVQQSTLHISHPSEPATIPVLPTPFAAQLPLRTAQDADMAEVADLSDDSDDCDPEDPARKVHFAEDDDVQPYSQAEKPTDVRSLMSFTQKTSDKLSFLRDQKIYDTKTRLEVRGAALASAVVLTVADATKMDALWAKVVAVNQNIDEPSQIHFKLDEGSQPSGYDSSEDQKRFRFGKRAEEALPEFIKRCQEAAHALAREAEVEEEAEEVNGDGWVKDVVGVIDLMWRG